MRIIFAGTPDFAAHALMALVAEHEIILVLTQPDRPAGRGMQLTASPVKQVALQKNLPVLQPQSLKDPAIQLALNAAGADVMVVAAYGLILPQAVLSMPRFGCINIHASLLPRWRGAAPIQRAILAGDNLSGITIMQMDAGLDTGPSLLQQSIPLTPHETAQTLHDKLAQLGAEMIVQALAQLGQGEPTAIPQPGQGATYAAKLDKSEAALDWAKSALELDRAVRAYNPFPGAYTQFEHAPLKIWKARPALDYRGAAGEILDTGGNGILVACGSGALLIEELQKPGGKRLTAAQFIAGNSLPVGVRLGT